jgi:hypothetical protein
VWQWQFDPARDYSVSGAYQLMTSQQTATLDATEDLIWHKHVPLKVSIFVWRLLKDGLPTKDNLVSRGIMLKQLTCVYPVAAVSNQLSIYSYHAVSLVRFGR